MGSWIMGSQGTGGTLGSKSHASIRQGPLYNLTLDEIQSELGNFGKPLINMNLDELLNNIWNFETNQKDGNFDFFYGNLAENTNFRDLRKKTVDEIWQDIQQGKNGNNSHDLGEMTLEDFLVKAEVVSEYFSGKKMEGQDLGVDPTAMAPRWMPYMQGHPMENAIYISENQIVDYNEPHMGVLGAFSEIQTPGRKRVASGDLIEKSVDRRSKRMIKNRESAARSRARKQAYTNELENKVSRLEEENERLKRMKEVEKLLPSPPPEPKYQLRRTSSAPL